MKTFTIVHRQTHIMGDTATEHPHPLDQDLMITVSPDILDKSLWIWQREEEVGDLKSGIEVVDNRVIPERLQWMVKQSKEKVNALRVQTTVATIWLAIWDSNAHSWRSLLNFEEVFPLHRKDGFTVKCKTYNDTFTQCTLSYDKLILPDVSWLERENDQWRYQLSTQVRFKPDTQIQFDVTASCPWHYTISIDLGTSGVCIYALLNYDQTNSIDLYPLHINKTDGIAAEDLLESSSKILPSYVAYKDVAGELTYTAITGTVEKGSAEDTVIPNIKMLALQSKVNLGDKERDSEELISEVFATLLGLDKSSGTASADHINYADLKHKQWVTDVRFSVPNIFNRQLFDHIYGPLSADFLKSQCQAYFPKDINKNVTTSLSYVSESEAILLYYLHNHIQDLPTTSLVIVLDIGAGTTDLTLARIDIRKQPSHNVKIIGHTGLPMGGNYYDYLVAEALAGLHASQSSKSRRFIGALSPAEYVDAYKRNQRPDEIARDWQIKLKEFVRQELKPGLGLDEYVFDNEILNAFIPKKLYKAEDSAKGHLKPEFLNHLLEQPIKTSLGNDTLEEMLNKITVEPVINLLDLCKVISEEKETKQLLAGLLENDFSIDEETSAAISQKSPVRLILSGRASRFKPVSDIVEQFCHNQQIELVHLLGDRNGAAQDSEDKFAVAMGTCLSSVYQFKKIKPNAVKTLEQEDRTLFNVYVAFYEAGGDLLEIKPLYDCCKPISVDAETEELAQWPLDNIRTVKVFSAYTNSQYHDYQHLDKNLLDWLETTPKILISQFILPLDIDLDNSVIEIRHKQGSSQLFPVWEYLIKDNTRIIQTGQIFPPNGSECQYQPSEATYESLWPHLNMV